jgi:hypothetical protein
MTRDPKLRLTLAELATTMRRLGNWMAEEIGFPGVMFNNCYLARHEDQMLAPVGTADLDRD